MTIHAAVVLALFAAAQDSPGWRGAARDGALADFKAPKIWPKELKEGWSVEVGTGHSTPALVGGRLYIHARQGDEEVILCLDVEKGTEIWRDSYEARYDMDPTAGKHGKGPKSSPVVADGRLFTFGISGVLSCLDASKGAVIWRHDFADRFEKTSPRYGVAMSPIVLDGMCIVHAGGPEKGAIIAFDVATGKERWNWDGDAPAYASPVVATVGKTKQLITQTKSYAVGLSPSDGSLLWKLEYKTAYDQNSVTPLVVGNLLILSGYKNGTIAYTLDGGKPEEAWKTTKVSMYMSSPVAAGDRFFGFSEKRRGQYFCADAKSGETLWTGDGRQGANAAVLIGDGAIIALNTKSELIVFTAGDKKYEELARYKVAKTPTWAHPVISGRAVYVKDEKSVTRWDIPQ